jgi:hypothetical protein
MTAGEKCNARFYPTSTCNVMWVKPGIWAGKKSTCSRFVMRLDLDALPIGVMREKGMPTPLAACMMMIAEQWELWRAEGQKSGCCWYEGERKRGRQIR